MELNDKEKELFRIHDKDLIELPSYHVEYGLIQSYSSNDETVQITYGYIKRILMEVANKRGLTISDNECFDMDKLLRDIVEIPTNLYDFDALYYKDNKIIDQYIDNKTKDKSSEEIEEVLHCFNGIGGINDSFRKFMTNYIPKLANKIDKLNAEISEVSYDNKEGINNEFNNDEQDEIVEVNETEAEDWSDWEGWEDVEAGWEVEGQEFAQSEVSDEKVTDEELIDFIKYVNSFSELIKYKNTGKEISEKLVELYRKTKLKEFYSDKPFLENLKKIMEHDKKIHTYHFHGTQDLESAKTIMSEGLGMMKEELSTTSYSEFTMDQIILYSRGLGGEIGRDAIIIIDEPTEEDGKKKKIVEPLSKDQKIHFSPSGLQGLNGKPEYIVNPRYIVGYVDKRNKEIIYNPRYYEYDRFGLQSTDKNKLEERPKRLPYDDDRIANGVLEAKINELIAQKDQNELQQ